jgi:ABC-type nitrate/sulfonate/bicarbonate transport system substrate-binding protein
MGKEKEMATDKKQVDRRVFLKGALATGAGLALAGCTTPQTPAPAAAPTAAPAAPAAAQAPAAPPQVVVATRTPVQVVRFVFAPDPVWSYMNDTGIVAKYEDKYNIKMVNTTTGDEVAWFVGGHADIASLGSFEVPIVAKNTGRDFTIFGKYNCSKNTFYVKADSPYKTMADLKGKRISVGGPGQIMAWGALLQKVNGLDFQIGKGDYNLYVAEYPAMPPLLVKGDVQAAVCEPEKMAPYVVSGQVRFLNDQTYGTPWEFYRDNFDPTKKQQNLMSNTFVAQTDWFNKNPKAVEAFLVMWQEGLDAWWKDRATIIKSYPDFFALSSDEEVAWLIKYMDSGHDWFVHNVALDDQWIPLELKTLSIFRETGRIDKSIPDPKMAVVKLPTS